MHALMFVIDVEGKVIILLYLLPLFPLALSQYAASTYLPVYLSGWVNHFRKRSGWDMSGGRAQDEGQVAER